MKVYLNWRGPQGIETVDEFDREPNQTPREFRASVKAMIDEYHLAGMGVYKSTRPCQEWKKGESK